MYCAALQEHVSAPHARAGAEAEHAAAAAKAAAEAVGLYTDVLLCPTMD